jgi:hypothetical protein
MFDSWLVELLESRFLELDRVIVYVRAVIIFERESLW